MMIKIQFAGILFAASFFSSGAAAIGASVDTASAVAPSSQASAPWVYPVLTPYRVAPGRADVMEFSNPGAIRLGGFLGNRVLLNEKNRLVKVDDEPLLAGFKKKPGVHPWIGEHVGKWLHASTLAWAHTGDAALRLKLDRVVRELIAAQEVDGYLGTYTPDKRFGLFPDADWDVWSHKYNLLGLLTYYQYTGYEPALAAARRIGDLLAATFGESPGRKSILSAGTHVGMAATSVLEPVVLLYRFTGEPRYLEFARYIVRSWDEPGGPGIVKTLLREKSVRKTANAKAYEMLSNLVGLAEFIRATGDVALLEALTNAWEDIVRNRLYLTGTASAGEHFQGDHELPNGTAASVGETCVTTTWIQFNSQLLRLTGDARYGTELERSFYNHLAAAQRPDGAEWCYYTSLEGVKPYGPGINCCVSSGPRGMAMVPSHAVMRFHEDGIEGLAVNLFEPARGMFEIEGTSVGFELESGFPLKGESTVVMYPTRATRFMVKFRSAPWMGKVRVKVNGHETGCASRAGWVEVPSRGWRAGDSVTVSYTLGPRVEQGTFGNAGLQAMAWGPFVLAYDQRWNPGLPGPRALGYANSAGMPALRLASGNVTNLSFETWVRRGNGIDPHGQRAALVPFADAGGEKSQFRVWLPAPATPLAVGTSVVAGAGESRSREGNVEGSVIDGDKGSFVVTFDNRPAREDWYALELAQPLKLRAVTFFHGKSFHDGGWFDAAAGGKPRLEVRRTKDGPWERVAEFGDYPSTTATSDAGLKQAQSFEASLPGAIEARALRVIGKPACGDNPNQAFSSCAEISVETEQSAGK